MTKQGRLMKKIVITVPKKKGDRWKVSMFNTRGKSRANASTAFLYVERELGDKINLNSRFELKEKTAVRVNYGQGFINESLDSSQPQYLLNCLAIFLEDYISSRLCKEWTL